MEAVAIGGLAGLFIGLVLGVLLPVPPLALLIFLPAYAVAGGLVGRANR